MPHRVLTPFRMAPNVVVETHTSPTKPRIAVISLVLDSTWIVSATFSVDTGTIVLTASERRCSEPLKKVPRIDMRANVRGIREKSA